VSIKIDADYGQPSVLAYKVLQAIFLKVAETGCSISEDGRCLYSDTVSFSARELALIIGRAWGGRTSRQLFEAIMQLQGGPVTAKLCILAIWAGIAARSLEAGVLACRNAYRWKALAGLIS
jgi:hypothetical protein